VIAATGGQHGGGARLTDFGRELLERYRRLEALAQEAAGPDLAALEILARPVAGPKI
jgi:molybdate transport system regulatory protein